MAKFMNLCALLVACCVFISAQYAAAAPTRPTLTVRIYHGQSQKLLLGTKSPAILHADGVYPG